ncbi:MAG: hypothetical protein ACLUFK_11010, partial [Oscillospiraceae bacterium]
HYQRQKNGQNALLHLLVPPFSYNIHFGPIVLCTYDVILAQCSCNFKPLPNFSSQKLPYVSRAAAFAGFLPKFPAVT